MQAAIFDFDGVLVDSEKFWKEEENRMFDVLIPGWKPDDHHLIVGMNIPDTYEFFTREFGINISIDEYLKRYTKLGDQVYEQCSLIDGVQLFLQKAQKRGLRIGIASSAPRTRITYVLEKFDIASFFACIKSAENVPAGKGKPDPTIYLIAAKALGVDSQQCIVIEDAKNGILAAKAAGMYCIALRNGMNDDQDLSFADEIVRSFKDIDIARLRKMTI